LTTPEPSARRNFRTAIWFGLVIGTAETSALAARTFLLDGINHVSPQVVWMAPVVYVTLFVAIAAVVLALNAVRRFDTGAVIVATVTFLGAVAVLALPGLLHPAAVLLLATGIAIQSTLWIRQRHQTLDRLVRVSFRPLVACVLLLTLGVNGWFWLRERQALGRRPAAAAGAPNIILIVWDTVRAASLGLYGFAVPTPNLDRLARRGVTFDLALATAPWTLPSHASLFTGHVPNSLSATWFDPLDDRHMTLAEAMSARGYRTGGFVSNLLYTTGEFGLDRGFAHYEDYRVSAGQAVLSTSLGRIVFEPPIAEWRAGLLQHLLGHAFLPGRKTADMVNENVLEWIDEEPAEPFFAFLNYFDAHSPYDAPAHIRRQFEPAQTVDPPMERVLDLLRRTPPDSMSDAELRAMLASYEASIAWLDDQLGVLMDELDRRGTLDNTIVILTSDHGEEFEEHGSLGHGLNLYFWQLRVPLVLVAPGRAPAGTRITQPVSIADVPATIAQWTPGFEPARFPGTPLQATWAAADSSSPPPIAELSPGENRQRVMRSIVSDGLYYIRNIDQSVEVYDLATDPFQVRPLTIDSARHAHLRRLLDARLACAGSGCRTGLDADSASRNR
jgi:arylsulfatase A-like enzyme